VVLAAALQTLGYYTKQTNDLVSLSMFSCQKSKVLPVTGPQNHALQVSSFRKHLLRSALSCLSQMLEYPESWPSKKLLGGS
jgi:hypothetical protein